MKRILLAAALHTVLLLIITPLAHAGYTLQLATYPWKSNAEKYVKQLKEQEYDAFIHTQERQISTGGLWYKVRMGPFPTEEAALEQKRAMLARGFEGEILLVESQPTESEAVGPSDGRIEEILLSESRAAQRASNQSSAGDSDPSVPGVQLQEETASRSLRKQNAREITLEWDPNTEADLAGYKIYYDTDPSRSYAPDRTDYAEEGPPPILVGKDVTRKTLHGLTRGKDYYFSVTAYNTSGIESGKSRIVTDRPEAPMQARGETAGRYVAEKEDQTITREEASVAVGPPAVPEEPTVAPELEVSGPPAKSQEPRGVEREPVTSPDSDTQPARARASYVPPFSPEDALGTTILSTGDTLLIEIPGQKQMSHDYDIGPDGSLYFLALGKIPAHGLAIADLDRVVSKKARRYVEKGEKILIQLVDIKRYINVRGGARYAGWYRVSPWTGIDDLIGMAGGLLSPEGRSGIRLLRPTKDRMVQVDIESDFMLHSNDVLDIPFPTQYQQKIDSGDLLFVSIPRKAPRVYEGGGATESTDFKRELQQNQIEVDKNGYLYIPQLGHLYVRDLTTSEIEKLIEGKLPKYLALAEKVIVSIVEKKHFVQVYGHVHSPGRLNIQETGTVQEALSSAGNAIDGAIMSNIAIHRRVENRLRKIKVNMYQYTITGDERLLTPLHEDDTLFVPISSNFGNVKRTLDAWEPPTERLEEDVKAKVRIFGAVNNVGIYEPQEDMDLIDLFILASGQTEDADLSKVLLIRNNRIELSFNMEEWLEKFAEQEFNPVPKLRNGDTVYVTFVKKKTHEPKEDELFYTLGEVGGQGQHKLWDRMTVLQALALAGGLNDFADAEHILIVRWVEGRQENIPFNFYKAVQGKLPELNMYVQARDVIYVP